MSRHPIYVVLDNIRSALNVGAIFRTSDGANIEKLFLTGITPYPPHNRIPKTALGSIDTVPWERNPNTMEIIDKLSAEMPIISVEISPTAVDYTQFQYKFPVALVLGNEINGISNEIMQKSTAVIKIPMYGVKESLNVSTAYGIIVYELLRQYNASNNNG